VLRLVYFQLGAPYWTPPSAKPAAGSAHRYHDHQDKELLICNSKDGLVVMPSRFASPEVYSDVGCEINGLSDQFILVKSRLVTRWNGVSDRQPDLGSGRGRRDPQPRAGALLSSSGPGYRATVDGYLFDKAIY
jgi:hypothetical protein